MKTRAEVSLVAVFLTIFCIDLVAQKQPQVIPGTRIRVLSPTYVTIIKDSSAIFRGKDFRFVGHLKRLDADSLLIEAEFWPNPVAIPLTAVKKLEVYQRRKKSRALSGAGVGFLIGATAGWQSQAASPLGMSTHDPWLLLAWG